MPAQCPPHFKWLSIHKTAAVLALITIANASEMAQSRITIQNQQLKDECVALSNAMALQKLGITVIGHTLTQSRIAKRLGREFEAAHATFPDSVASEVVAHVLLNNSSRVTSEVLRDLTSRGALVLSLSTKRLLGDRSGSANPDHAVHIREIIRKRGVDYMVVENCWGRGWGRGGEGHVPVTALRELPYVYGLFLRKRDAPKVSMTTFKVLTARPFYIAYASGRSYPQPKSTFAPKRTGHNITYEVNRFMNELLASK